MKVIGGRKKVTRDQCSYRKDIWYSRLLFNEPFSCCSEMRYFVYFHL